MLSFSGVFIEKGMGLMLPGMTPDALGEVYIYTPSMVEIGVAAGIWAIGALLFTLMVKVSSAITAGELREQEA
jgi:molybdopterin-containing oxidoreductase family membrane subunit